MNIRVLFDTSNLINIELFYSNSRPNPVRPFKDVPSLIMVDEIIAVTVIKLLFSCKHS